MKLLLAITITIFSSTASAEWYENKKIDWWVLVYSKMICEKATKYGKEYNPMHLIKEAQCTYEAENSYEGEIASIGCEKKIKGGFIFAINEASCAEYIEIIKEALQGQ